MSAGKKKEKDKKTGWWEFFKGNMRSPTTLELLYDIARADFLIDGLKALRRQQRNFDKETKRIEELKTLMSITDYNDSEYKRLEKELNRILKL